MARMRGSTVSRIAAGLGLSIGLLGCASDPSFPPPHTARSVGACVIGGCSDEVCSAQPEVSSCIWYDAYACYWSAVCEVQADGQCGWTASAELDACLATHNGPGPGH